MFESKKALTDYVNALFSICSTLDRGEYLEHSRISDVLGVKPHQGHWQWCIVRLKRRMEAEREISLWPENRLGYRLLTKDEQLTMLPKARMKRARKQIRQARDSVAAISIESLSEHQMRIRVAQLELLNNTKERLEAEARLQAALEKEYEPTPRPRELQPA